MSAGRLKAVTLKPFSLTAPFAPAALLADLNVPATGQDAVTWLRLGFSLPTSVREFGGWTSPAGSLVVTDPFAPWSFDTAPIAVPAAPAEMVALRWSEGFRPVEAIPLVWSTAPVICGMADVSAIRSDTGQAAFLTPEDLTDLRDFGAAHSDSDDDTLYQNPSLDQTGSRDPGPVLSALPPGATFPVFGVATGDASSAVSALFDGNREMVALYAQFISSCGDDWVLSPPCSTPMS